MFLVSPDIFVQSTQHSNNNIDNMTDTSTDRQDLAYSTLADSHWNLKFSLKATTIINKSVKDTVIIMKDKEQTKKNQKQR